MTISFPLTAPSTPKPQSVAFSQTNIVSVTRSPFTLVQQVQEFDGSGWLLSVNMPPMTRAEAAPWISFLTKLRGIRGTFYYGDTMLATPQGTAAGTPLVNGTSQTGFTLVTDGWDNSSAILLEGDLIQIDDSLYLITADATSDGSGNATLDIWPRLRSHADNASIITSNTKGLWRLLSDTTQAINDRSDRLYTVSFQAEEAIT